MEHTVADDRAKFVDMVPKPVTTVVLVKTKVVDLQTTSPGPRFERRFGDRRSA